jgi:hypothetical protein
MARGRSMWLHSRPGSFVADEVTIKFHLVEAKK